MKLDILIVDFAMVAAIFLPYLLFIFIGRREKVELQNKFSEEMEKNHLQIEQKDEWNHNIIGLDKTNRKVLLVQKRKTGITTDLIDLRAVRSCEILQELQAVKIDRCAENVLQKLDLQLKLHDGSVQKVNLYNYEETYSQDYEVKHAERWCRTINELAAFRPTINSAA